MQYKYPEITFNESSFYYYGMPLYICLSPKKEEFPEVHKAWKKVFDSRKKDKLPSKYVGLVLNYIFLKIEEDRQEAKEREQKETWKIRGQNIEIKELQEKIKELQEELKKAQQFKLNFN
jgi:hypothetical protein